MPSSTPPASQKRFRKQATKKKMDMVKAIKDSSSTPLEKVLSPRAKLKTKQWLDIQLNNSLGFIEVSQSESLGFDSLDFAECGARLHNELLQKEPCNNATGDLRKPNDRESETLFLIVRN